MLRRTSLWTALVFLSTGAAALAQTETVPADSLAQQSTFPPSNLPADLPEAPTTVVEGRLDGVGSQGQAVSGRTVVQSPNLTPTTLADTGSSVTVITAEQIAQRGGQNNVAEILRGLVGVDVVRQGSPGSVTSVFLRGAGAQHTKVLIDNIPANDPTNPQRAYDFSNLSVDNIERIEIIRGPQSVLYGSDAIGGVINIITKKGSGPLSGRVAGMGGAYSTANTVANASGSQGDVYYSAGGSYFNTHGFSSAAGGVEPDAFSLGTFSSRVGWQPSDNFTTDVIVRYNQANTDIDFVPLDTINDGTTYNQLVTGVRMHYINPAGWYEQTLAYYVSSINREFRGPTFGFSEEYDGVTQQIDSRHTFHLLDGEWIGNSFTVGGQYQTETGTIATSPRAGLHDGAAYGQDVIRVGDNWFTTLGLRSDNYNAYGVANTYRATSLYRVPLTLTAFRASLGTGFRAPAISERFPPFGNVGILPEESKGWDVGVEQPLFDGAVVPSITYFRNDFTNLVIANPLNGFSIENVARARATGVEYATLFVLDDRTTVTTSYTYTDTVDLSPGQATYDRPLIRRPLNKFGLVFNRGFLNNRLNWNVSGVYVGDREDSGPGPNGRVRLAPYTLVNTGMTYDVTRRFQVFGRIDNVFNEDYQEVYGYNVASASGYAGAALTW